jgi:peroxiredoxin
MTAEAAVSTSVPVARVAQRVRTGAWLRAGLLLFAVATLTAAATAGTDRGGAAALVGREAPDFAERVVGGGNLRLSEHRGEVVLLGFWTSWCGTCREYLDRLGRLHATYGSAGLVVVGVSLDDDAARAASLVKSVDARFPNVFDAGKRLGRGWFVADVPMTVLVDRSGVVRAVYGDLDRRTEGELVGAVRRLLDE